MERRAAVARAGLRVGAMAGALAVVAAAAGCADDAGPRAPTPAAAAARCTDARFPVYFARGSAELQPESAAVVTAAARGVAGCRIVGVDVTGVAAPDAGGAVADPALVQRRQIAVGQALTAAGLPAPMFDVQVAGAHAPLPRRTEVVLHARPSS